MKSAYLAHWDPKRYHITSTTKLQHGNYTALYNTSARLNNAHTPIKHAQLISWTER